MSTITLPTISPVPVPNTEAFTPSQVGSTGQTASTGAGALSTSDASPPLYLDFGLTSISLATLGLRMPQAPGDTAAILAEVSDALDRLMDEDRNRRREAAGSALRSLFGNLASLSAAINGHIDAYNAYAQEKETKTQQRAGKIEQRDAKVAQRDGLNDAIDAFDEQITDLQQRIANTSDGATKAALQAQLGVLTGQRSVAVNERNAVNTQIAALDADIAELTAEIDTAQRNMDTEQAAIDTLEAARDAALALLATFALTASQRDEALRDSEASWDIGITRLFEDLATNLSEFQAALAESARAVETQTVPSTETETNPTDVNVENLSTPGVDKSAPPPPDAVLARLNAAAVALTTALSQVLAVLAGLETLPDDTSRDEDAPRLRIPV